MLLNGGSSLQVDARMVGEDELAVVARRVLVVVTRTGLNALH